MDRIEFENNYLKNIEIYYRNEAVEILRYYKPFGFVDVKIKSEDQLFSVSIGSLSMVSNTKIYIEIDKLYN